MITFFPEPYKDELFYSILARYHIRSSNTSYKSTNIDLYNRNTNNAFELPSNFNILITNIPKAYNIKARKLILNNTMYNYLTAYAPEERSDRIYHDMLNTNGRGIYSKLGHLKKKVKINDNLLFCPYCCKEDIERFGETYWRRIHQIVGVKYCLKHRCLLVKYKKYSRLDKKSVYINITRDIDIEKCLQKSTIVNNIPKQHIRLIKAVEYLLNNNKHRYSPNYFIDIYRKQLIKFGWCTESQMYLDIILVKFKKFWGEKFLSECGLNFEIDINHSWLCRMLRKVNSTSFPLQHILISIFLDLDIRAIFDNKNEEVEKINISKKQIILSKVMSREKWIKIVNDNPALSRRMLAAKDIDTYEFLIKNDYKWLFINTPKIKNEIHKNDI